MFRACQQDKILMGLLHVLFGVLAVYAVHHVFRVYVENDKVCIQKYNEHMNVIWISCDEIDTLTCRHLKSELHSEYLYCVIVRMAIDLPRSIFIPIASGWERLHSKIIEFVMT